MIVVNTSASCAAAVDAVARARSRPAAARVLRLMGALVEEVRFGYRSAWLATRTDAPDRVVQSLGLRNVAATSPARGIHAASELQPPGERKVFVTPPVHGWVLCVGHALFAFADSKDPAFGDLIVRLSAELRCDVQFFCTHRVVEGHGWGRAVRGQLLRAYLYIGESDETAVNHGEQTADEQYLGFGLFSRAVADRTTDTRVAYPTEEDVVRLAGRWSVDPTQLPPMADGLIGDLALAPGDSMRPGPPREAVPRSKRWWKFW